MSPQFFSETDRLLIGIGRFSANTVAKIKFEIYGGRKVRRDKHIGTVEKTIKDLLDACDEDGGEWIVRVQVCCIVTMSKLY